MRKLASNLRLLAGAAFAAAALFTAPLSAAVEVNILTPGSGDVTIETIVPVRLTAYDPDGLIDWVEIRLNGVSIITYFWDFDAEKWEILQYLHEFAQVRVPPFLTDVQIPSIGVYQLQAWVRSTTGDEALSNEVLLTGVLPDAGGGAPPPIVSILAPFDGSRYLPGTRLPVMVDAYVASALIEKVELLLNDVIVGTITEPPFVADVSLPSVGTYTLKARATTTAGGSAFSNLVSLTAEHNTAAPKVFIDHPLPLGAGDTVNDVSVASSMFLNVVVQDDGGPVPLDKVTFYINGFPLGHPTSRRGDVYARFFTPYAPGNYSIMAVAEDADGNLGYSAPLPLDVGPLERPLPQGFVFPQPAGLQLGVETVVTIYADGGLIPVDRVDLYVDGILAGSAETPLDGKVYGISWTPPETGAYNLQARIVQIDPAGATYDNWKITDAVAVTVVDNPPVPSLLSVSILAPFDGAQYLPGTRLPVQIEAYDPGGLIAQLQVLMNGVVIATTSPGTSAAGFSVDVELPSIGSYALQVRATSTTGAQALSNLVNLVAAPHDETVPRVFIDHPLPLGAGDTVNDVSIGSAMFLNAVATDGDGSIADVRFYVNGVLLGSATGRIGDVYSLYFMPNAQGSYSIMAEAVDNDGKSAFSVPMPLIVGPLERPLPQGYVIQPFAENVVGQPLAIQAYADGNLIEIDRVDFYADGVLLGSVSEPLQDGGKVYGITWTPPATGVYDLQARIVQIDPAEADFDNWRITAPVPVTIVDQDPATAPTITLIKPVDGAELTVLNPIALQAEADNPVGTVAEVRFYANGSLIGTDATYPYSLSFPPQSPGRYVFVAELVTDRGYRYHSAPSTVRVRTSQAPSVSITYPVDGAAVSVGTPVLITASAESTGGSEMTLRFYANGVFIGEDDSFPYSQIWQSQSTGSFALMVEAIETATGAVAASDQVRVTVNPTALPTASIVQPGDVNPTVGSDVLIEVEATDADGYVDSVEFFVNGVSLGEPDRTEPFATFWRPGSAGQYTLTALVTDNSGNQVVTSKVVTVVQPVGIVPRVTLSVTASGNVTPGSRVMVRANVFDDDPTDLRVVFFMNGVQLAPADTVPPYSIIVDPVTLPGRNFYSLTAVAFDRDGNSRADTLSPLYISDVTIDQPSVEIISLEEGANLTLGSRAPIRVKVEGGAVSSIATVVFYADGVEIGRNTTAPYAFDWIPDRTGPVQITAATLLRHELYDHDGDSAFAVQPTPMIPVTPVNIASPVNVVVNEAVGILPSISLDIQPASTNLAIGSKVLIYADAQDLDGEVVRVDFFMEGVLVGTDTVPPFTHILTTERQGTFALNALATDNSGNVVTSTYVNLEVSPRVVTQTPGITLTVPDSGQEGSLLSLRASTAGFVNPPEAVVFFANGQPIGESATVPYSYSWLVNLNGDVAFFATAQQTLFDGTVLTTVSDVVVSSMAVNTPPVITGVEVLFPNQSAAKPDPLVNEPVTFRISVEDTGPIRSVELLRDGDPVAELIGGASPYEIVDTPPGLGLYQYSVVVTDRGGLQAQSAVIPVSVVVGQGPVVAITAPEADAVFQPNAQVQLRATASDPDGVVTEVTFFVNGLQVGSPLAAAPYSVMFQPAVAGTYTVTARARDNSGNLAESAPVAFTVLADSPPQFLQFGNDLPGTVARLNQVVTWTMDATDDYALVSVKLYRDGTEVTSPVAIPLELTDMLTSIGRFRYYAEATDSGGNVTRSAVIEITTTRGTAPLVEVTHPLPNTSYNLAETVTLRASATAAPEPAGQPAGSIASVRFLINGALKGTVTQTPYALPGVSLQEGANVVTAIATSDTGLTTVSQQILVYGVDGSVPEIVSFTSDKTGTRTLVGSTVTFTVLAVDEKGIQQIELLWGDAVVAVASASPANFQFVPTSAGTYRFRARVTNVNGLQAESNPLDITVRNPDPLGSNGDFVAQTFVDLLMRSATGAEQNGFASRLDSGDLSRDRFIRELMSPPAGAPATGYADVRGAMLANWFLLGQWPVRAELEADAGTVRDGGLAALVASLMIEFEDHYKAVVNPAGVPDILSTDAAIGEYVAHLFGLKYGVAPNADQLKLGKLHFRASGRDAYTAAFIQDNEVIATSTGWVTLGLGFKFPTGAAPSDAYLRQADAASLIINLLRIVPDDDQVAALAGKLFAAQVAEVLADPRYAARFSTAFPSAYTYPDGWRHSDWFGAFNAAQEPWVFHDEQGWIGMHTTGNSPDNLWYYDSSLGWVWTSEGLYPFIYVQAEDSWYWSARAPFKAEGQRWFYSAGAGGWILN